MIEMFNAWKIVWSLIFFLTLGLAQPQAEVPTFESPEAAWGYLAANYTYTGDPAGGAIDFFTSPYVFQGAMQMGPAYAKTLNIDCDDVGAWSYVAIRNMGGAPVMYTLEDASGRFGHHVVTAYTWHGQQGTIDTNGHRRLPDISGPSLCAEFTRVYATLGYRYVRAVLTPCPW